MLTIKSSYTATYKRRVVMPVFYIVVCNLKGASANIDGVYASIKHTPVPNWRGVR
jgi:hypothetical protein